MREVILSPSSRNAPFVDWLTNCEIFHVYTCPEERSAAFFAIGRMMATGVPVAVVTTSGTAAGELLPAAMEAFYSSLPLVLVTADRPRRFRGTGAPQSALQEKLFGPYTPHAEDLEGSESCSLHKWDQRHPAHLNVCLEEPEKTPLGRTLSLDPFTKVPSLQGLAYLSPSDQTRTSKQIHSFFERSHHPFAIVGALRPHARPWVRQFLLDSQLPVYLEGLSGLREDPLLAGQAIRDVRGWQKRATQAGYPIDGVLRLGGIPTARLWRDLEETEIPLLSLSEAPFPGICRGKLMQMAYCDLPSIPRSSTAVSWLTEDKERQRRLEELFTQEPLAEPSLIHTLSHRIHPGARVYLGNSLPIREWDFAASYASKQLSCFANRGVNGIDGQISSFLGISEETGENWGLVGDLTALYDFAGLWLAGQLSPRHLQLVIVNNQGGKIFQKLFTHPIFQNRHQLSFAPYADFWGWEYARWERELPPSSTKENYLKPKLVELIPCPQATERFWQLYDQMLPVM